MLITKSVAYQYCFVFTCIRFEGGLIEHCCRASDGLAAALEVEFMYNVYSLCYVKI